MAAFVLCLSGFARMGAQETPLPPGAVARLGQASFWHGTLVRALDFSPDEKLIASFGQEDNVCIWETGTGKLLHRLDCPRAPGSVDERFILTPQGRTLQFSGDGKTVALADLVSRICRSWDVASGNELPSIALTHSDEQGEAQPAFGPTRRGVAGIFALSHDGRLVAQAQVKDHTIHLLASGKKEPVHKLPGHKGGVLALAFAADGKMLASSGQDQIIRLWNVQTGQLVRSLTGHRAAVQEIAFSPDGKRLISASVDAAIRLWDLTTGQTVVQTSWQPAHRLFALAEVRHLWIDRDGRRFGAFCSLDFDYPNTGICEHIAVRFDVSGKVESRQIFHDRVVASAEFGVGDRAVNRAIAARTTPVAVAPGRNLLARASDTGHVSLLDLTTGLPAVPGLSGGCADLAMAGDHVAIVQQNDPLIYLWNWKAKPDFRSPQDFAALRKLEGHTGIPFLTGFAPDGRTLVSTCGYSVDRSLSVWDVTTGRELRTVNTSPAPMPRLSPDGKRFVYCDADGQLRVVDLATGNDIVHLSFAWRGNGSVAFSADGQRLVVSDAVMTKFAAGADGMGPLGGGKGMAKGALAKGKKAFDPRGFPGGGGPTSASIRTACQIHLLDIAGGKELGQLNAHPYDFCITSLHVAGQHSLAGCRDGVVRAVDLESAKVRDVWNPWGDTDNDRFGPGFSGKGSSRPLHFVVAPDRRMIAVRPPDTSAIKLIEVVTGRERLTLPPEAGAMDCMCFSADGQHFVTGSRSGQVLVWTLGPLNDPGGKFEAAALWHDLTNADGISAFASLRRLIARPAEAVALAQKHLQPATPLSAEAIAKKIRDLDSPIFLTRQKAQDDLTQMGDEIRARLEKAAADKDASIEMKQRVAQIVQRLNAAVPIGDRLRELRAVELLERIGAKEARTVLERLAKGAEGAGLTQEAQAALARLTSQERR
jgi:WD40 repeat protein